MVVERAWSLSLCGLISRNLFGFWSALIPQWQRLDECLGTGDFQVLVVTSLGHERIVSLESALALLCILDLLSSLSALGHGKRWRIHGIDLTVGYTTVWTPFGVLGDFLLGLRRHWIEDGSIAIYQALCMQQKIVLFIF